MGSDLYFFEQCETRKVAKRYRKLPEDLPESLRFAHLNPKVAALLASKERGGQKVDSEDPFGDGLGKKSLLPDINAAFQNVRNQFDSALSNDEDSQRYLFEEAKLSATTILHQLSQIIYFYEDLHKFVPKSLEYHLMSGFSEFTSDVVVVPREWQTQEMKEQYIAKQQQELNANSEEELSENEMNMLTGRTKSRLGTERSGSEFGSKYVKKTKPKLGAIEQDDTESIMPKSESRQGRRSDSRASNISQLRPHLDGGNLSRLGSRRKGGSSLGSYKSIYAPSPTFTRHRLRDDIFSIKGDTPSDARSTALANPLSYMQTINFQLSNSVFEDKGWIMLKGRQEEIDQNQILEYCVQRLQESLKSVTAQATKEVEQGYDKPVIVRYYGDAKKETLLKYRKSPNKMTPNLLNKVYKPKVPSIVNEKNEGKKLMQASHIDGSTVIYYPSGRPAVVYTAAGFGRPGYYTLVFQDGIDPHMLACFTPSGRGVCYYENGVVRFLATEKGGHLSEINGKLIRKWKWPQANVKITQPINFQISGNLMFRCVGQTQMTIVFSCHKEISRFSVGLAPEADEYKAIEETDQLLTAFTFSSKAAKDLMRIFAPAKKNKKKSRKKKDKNKKKGRNKKKGKNKKKDKTDGEMGSDYDVKKQVSFVADGEMGSDYDVKKQVSFVAQPIHLKDNGLFPQEPRTKRVSLSPDLLQPSRRQSVTPDKSILSEKGESDVSDTDVDDRNLISPDIPLSPFRRGSVSPDRKRQETLTLSGEQTKMSKLFNSVLSAVNDISSKPLPVPPSSCQKSDQMKRTSFKKQSITPEPPKVNKFGWEYCKRKRIQSAQNCSQRFYQFMHKKSAVTRKKVVKPEISKESNLVIQTEAYTENWEHKRIAYEEAKKAEKELKMENKLKAKESLMKKNAGLNERPKDGKSHSAKRQSVVVDVGKRAKSAQPYSILLSVNVKDKSEKPDYDQTAMEKREKPQYAGLRLRDISLFEENEEEGEEKETDGQKSLQEKVEDVDTEKSAVEPQKIPKVIVESPDGTTESILERGSTEDDTLSPLKPGMFRRRGLSLFQNMPDSSAKMDGKDLCKGKGRKHMPDRSEKNNGKNMPDSSEKINGKNMPDSSEKNYGKHIPDSSEEMGGKNMPDRSENMDGKFFYKRKGYKQSVIMDSIMAFRCVVLKKKEIHSSESEDDDKDDNPNLHTSKSQTSEILRLLQNFPDRVHYELEADKELARLQRKAKNLVDDWMEHYRIALGFKVASLQNVRDIPNYSIAKRNVKSAKLSDHQLQIRKAVLGVDDAETPRKKKRIPSAPLGGLGNEFIDEDFQAELTARQVNAGVTFEDIAAEADDGTLSPMATALINKLTENTGRRSARSRATSARSSSPARQPTLVSTSERVPSASLAVTRSYCPIVVRQQILGHERPQCRCSRHHIPFIMDLEIDDFVKTETPEGQLTVIMVVSSLKNIRNRTYQIGYDFYMNKEGVACRRVFPGITKAEETLNEIYGNQNRNRTRPCVQSRMDMFRVFKYDVNSAAEMSDHTQPLLMMRHNVVPGMILIYCDGKLFFCDHIFNGYGSTRKDFKKQLMKSRHDAIHGNALPKDFRFSPSRGKSGMRSAWGGEIGGAGVDKYSSPGTVVDNSLQPIHRPNSDSSDGELRANVHLDAVKLQAAQYLSMSLSTTGFQPATLPPQPIATNH